MKKLLFIDRDGTLIQEPADYQVDQLEKLKYYPGIFQYLGKIVRELDFELIMVTNQDGLGTASFPEENFWPVHNRMLQTFEGEGITFKEVLIDRTFAADKASTRKPGTGLCEAYLTGEYDLKHSYVIGDRMTDMEFALNLGAKGIWLNNEPELGAEEMTQPRQEILDIIELTTTDWNEVYLHLRLPVRSAMLRRKTKETDINIHLELDGQGIANNHTGLGFFDHMLDQLARHSGCNLSVQVDGDLHIDEHHTIEDTAIALGEAFKKAFGNKLGIERYGFCLPMDDCLAQVAIDFGGRNWLVWEATFNREKIGEMPTEMFHHFFKSFSDGAACNLNIKAEGINEHHKIEAIFKAFAKAIKMAKKRNPDNMQLPSTKGML